MRLGLTFVSPVGSLAASAAAPEALWLAGVQGLEAARDLDRFAASCLYDGLRIGDHRCA